MICKFIETIRIEVVRDALNHRLLWYIPYLKYHQSRIDNTSRELLGCNSIFKISRCISNESLTALIAKVIEIGHDFFLIPGDSIAYDDNVERTCFEVLKLRIVWSSCGIESIDIQKYAMPIVKGIIAIPIDALDNLNNYSYKFENRELFARLAQNYAFQVGQFPLFYDSNTHEVLDTSISNLVFVDANDPKRLFTPRSYLLPGTKRRAYIDSKIIEETIIRIEDIMSDRFMSLYFINGMVDIEDKVGCEIHCIKFSIF